MWYLVNVVWYNGIDAFVSKFIIPTDGGKVTPDSKYKVSRYLDGNGELLKIDPLYPVTLDNIVAFKTAKDKELQAAYDRCNTLFF